MTTQKTRCPYCSSVFAVSNAQLAIRDGYTRCGKCYQVFKADDYLIAVKGSETSADGQASDNQNKSRSHIVDLHKISATKDKGFDTALDSFLDKTSSQPESTEESTSIDYEHTKKEKIDLSIIPNPHPAPVHKTPETLTSSTTHEIAPIQETAHSLGQEFNEEWLSETTTTTHLITKPDDEPTSDTTTTKAQESASTKTTQQDATTVSTPKAEVKEEDLDDDLMGYLNKNSVPAASTTKVKTERILPGMNDFHANQRSKKKSKPLPMHFQAPKRNVTLDRLTARKPWLNINFLHILGWSVLSILMLGLLAAQYVYFNFDQLAANPRYQPVMHKACLQFGCDVPLIDIQKIKISKALARHYLPDPQGATLFTATMTNTAGESQPYPTIRLLVLKDRQVLSGRVLRPSEYLTSGFNSQARISANHPIQIEFVLKIPREQIPVFALDPVQ